MLAQNHTLRRHALGNFPRAAASVTSDPAMLLFLSLADSDKEAPNENFARELMELFTLGRGLHRARHPRGGAGAHRLPRRLARRRAAALLLREGAPRPGGKRIFGHRGRLRLEGRAAPVRGPPGARAVPRRTSSGTTSSRRARPGGHARRWRARTGAPATASSRWWPRSSPTPRSTGASTARHGQVAGGVRRGRAAQRRSGHRARRWSWLLEGMGQVPVQAALGGRLGLGHGVAVLQLDARALRRRQLSARHAACAGGGQVHSGGPRPAKALERARHAVGNPWISRQTDRELLRIARRLLDDRKRRDGGWRQPKQVRADMCQRVLRQLLVCGPDGQVH